MSKALLAPLVLSLAPAAAADVRLPRILGDHMVLQRDAVARVFGWAEPGERIEVHASWTDAVVRDVAQGDGAFEVALPTPAAGGPFTLSVRGRNTVELTDVLVGEVWVCSGQSNMEWTVGPGVGDGILNWETEVADADWPRIRGFDVARATALEPAQDCRGEWSVCSPATVGSYSAVAYFFGRALHRELDVPIGLVMTTWGGTKAEAWTSAHALRALGEFEDELDRIERARRDPASEPSLEDLQTRWWARLADVDPGTRAGWSSPAHDDSSWERRAVPAVWEEQGLEHDGVVWFRRTVDVPAGWAGRELVLELGSIDDMDTTWFAGVRVGGLEGSDHWRTPRAYVVPAELVEGGPTTIAVRVVDTGGAGGLTGHEGRLRLSRAAGVDDAGEGLELAGEWRARPGAGLDVLGAWPRTGWFHQDYPTALSNAMVAPLERCAIRGAIWYQGESNRLDAERYERLFPALIADWRRRFGRGDFPFYFVQIAPFDYGGDTGQAAALRDAQRKALSVPNTGMVVTLDVGDPRDIHPLDKQTVGRRLARWALDRTYGRDVGPVSGPLFASVSFAPSMARVTFEHVAGGLELRGPVLERTESGVDGLFELRRPDGRWLPATARVDGDELVLRAFGFEGLDEPTGVRYAWGAADEACLFNAAGLPASSFSSVR